MERLNNMHGEIKKIHQNKIAELRRKRIAAESFIRKNSRKFKKTRSARHEECHICLVQFENDAQVWTFFRNPLIMNPLIMKIFFCLPDKMTKFFENMGPYWYLYIMLYNNIILIFRQYDFPIVNMNVTRTVLDLGLERNQHVRVSFFVFSCFLTVRLIRS